MDWYKITARETHCVGNKGFQVIYMWDENITRVLNRYKKLGGVPRSKLPEIRPLNPEESSLLEKAIVEERDLKLEKAKKIPIRYYSSIPPV